MQTVSIFHTKTQAKLEFLKKMLVSNYHVWFGQEA